MLFAILAYLAQHKYQRIVFLVKMKILGLKKDENFLNEKLRLIEPHPFPAQNSYAGLQIHYTRVKRNEGNMLTCTSSRDETFPP